MAPVKEYQQQGDKNQHRFIQTLNDSLQELLYSHIDHLFKQWIKTFYNAAIFISSLITKIFVKNQVQVPENLLGVSLSTEQREVLGKGQETELIEGFTSKKGNRFAAYLKINEEGELKFRFPDKDKQQIPVEFLGVKLSVHHHEQLKNGNETALIEGLQGRRGIPFSGYLSLGEDGKIKIRFPIRGSVEQHVNAASLENQPNAFDQPSVPILTSQAADNLQEKPKAFDQPFVSILTRQAADNLQEQPNAFDLHPVFDPTPPPSLTTQTPPSLTTQTPSSLTTETHNPGIKGVPADINRSADLSGLEVYGRKISESEAIQLLSIGKTPLLDGFKTGSGKIFSAKLDYTNQKLSIHIPQRSVNTGISVIPKKIFGVEISVQSRRLLSGGRSTSLIENMISPAGVRFDGWLKFDQTHRLCVRSAERVREIQLPGKSPKSNEKGLTA